MFLNSRKITLIIALVLSQIFVEHAISQDVEVERVDVACEAETICDYNSEMNFTFGSLSIGTTKPWPTNVDSCGTYIPMWVAIIPNSDSIQLSIENSSCGNNQLKIGLFRGVPDCESWPYSFGMEGSLIGDCQARYPLGATDFDLSVEAGVKYYLVFGDSIGGACEVNFSIENMGTEIDPDVIPLNVKELSIPEFSGVDTVCIGADSIRFNPDTLSQNSEYYLWKVSDTVIKRPFIRPYLDLNDDYFDEEGEFDVCLASANDCDTSDYSCRTISVNYPSIKNITATQCLGYDFHFRDTIIETSMIEDPGVYEYGFFASSPTFGCDRFYNLTLRMVNGEKINYNSSYNIDSTTISFSNDIENQDSVRWYFGDGDSSTLVNPTHRYASFGEYDVVVDIFGGCDFVTDTFSVAVIPDLKGDIEAELPDSFCVPTTVEYMIDINDKVAVTWFIDGSEDTIYSGHSIEVNYIEPGIHNIYIQYSYSTNSNFYSQDTSFQNFMELYKFPSASFNDSISNKTIYLNASKPIDASSTYVWDFGDENTANGPSTIHTYQEKGTYIVELVETNPCGTEKMKDTISIETTPTTYIEKDNSISVFPNPFRDYIHISSFKEYNKVQLFNTQGEHLLTDKLTSSSSVKTISTSSLDSGVYYLRVLNENKSVVVKCVKVR